MFEDDEHPNEEQPAFTADDLQKMDDDSKAVLISNLEDHLADFIDEGGHKSLFEDLCPEGWEIYKSSDSGKLMVALDVRGDGDFDEAKVKQYLIDHDFEDPSYFEQNEDEWLEELSKINWTMKDDTLDTLFEQFEEYGPTQAGRMGGHIGFMIDSGILTIDADKLNDLLNNTVVTQAMVDDLADDANDLDEVAGWLYENGKLPEVLAFKTDVLDSFRDQYLQLKQYLEETGPECLETIASRFIDHQSSYSEDD